MLQMLNYLRCLGKSKKGQGMVEYGLIMGGVVVIVLAVLAALQGSGLQSSIENHLSNYLANEARTSCLSLRAKTQRCAKAG